MFQQYNLLYLVKTKFSKFLSESEFLLGVKMSPPVLNKRSTGALEGKTLFSFINIFFTFLKLSREVRSPLTDVLESKNSESLCLSSRPLKSNGSKDFCLSFRNNKGSYPRKQFLVENKS